LPNLLNCQKARYNIKGVVSLLVVIVGIILIFLGLYEYFLPPEYLGTVEHVTHRIGTSKVSAGDSFETSWMVKEEAYLLDWTYDACIKVLGDKEIDFYLFNETEYMRKKEGDVYEWVHNETDVSQVNILLKPVQELKTGQWTKYHFIFDNSRFNESKTLELDSYFRALIPSYNYDRVFTWGKVALIGTFVFVCSASLVLWFNREKLLNLFKLDIFPSASKTSVGKKVKKIYLVIFWLLLIVPNFLCAILVVISYFQMTGVAWVESRPIYTDRLIRGFLTFLLSALPLAFFYLISVGITGLSLHIIYHKLSSRSLIDQEHELNLDEDAFVSYYSTIKSKKSISLLLAVFSFAMFFEIFWPDYEVVFLLSFGCIFSAFRSLILFKSYEKSSETFGMNFKEVISRRRRIFILAICVDFWVIILLMSLLALYPMIAVPVYDMVWENYPGLQFWTDEFQTLRESFLSIVISAWEKLESPYFWESIVSWTTFAAVFGYLLPELTFSTSIPKKIRSLVLNVSVFVLTFVTKMLIGFIYKKELELIDSVIVALLASAFTAIVYRVLGAKS